MISPKAQKAAAVVIVLLLLLCLSFGGYGLFLHLTYDEDADVAENVNKEKYFDGKLWFYNEQDALLGTYTCDTENCDIGKASTNDEAYALESYRSTENDYLPIINDRYVFIHDGEGESLFLYDIVNAMAYKTNRYRSVKNYGVGIAGDHFIVSNDSNQYGVLNLTTNPYLLISINYSFIGLPNDLDENGEVISDYFVTLRDGYWNIIDKNQAILTQGITDEIVDFNGESIIVLNSEGYYRLIDYNGRERLSEIFNELSFIGRYLNCTTLANEFYLYDITTNQEVSERYTISPTDEVLTSVDPNNNIVISINGTVVETITG